MQLFKRPKISFVVIAYNREPYIRECMDSILEQNVEKEIICVDDCSTDATYDILREYQKKYKEVKVYQNDENLGTYLNRVSGMNRCKGDYMLQIDADDRLISGSMERVYQDALKTKADILEFRMVTDGERSYQVYRSDTSEILKGNLLQYYAGEDAPKISNTLCNKLISRDVYKAALKSMNQDLRQSNYCDIMYIIWHILSAAQSFAYSEVEGYFYYTTRGMTYSETPKTRLKNLTGSAITIRDLESTFGKSEYIKRKWNYICNQAVVVYLHMPEKEQEENRYLLDMLMKRKDSDFLIKELSKRLSAKEENKKPSS